jgi:hypothetical protein
LGIIRGSRLVLLSNEGTLLLPLDLPLGGTHVPVSDLPVTAVFCGMAGRLACFVDAGQLVSLDITDGTVRRFSLLDITGGHETAQVEAVADGVCVFAAGSRGILCVNPRTATRVFRAPWPEPFGFDGRPFSESPPTLHGAVTVDQHVMPPACCVERGLFCVRVTSHRVVALEGTGRHDG